VEKNPRVGELLEHTRKFIADWPRYLDEHRGVPEAKLWITFVANNPVGALGFNQTVDPADHLPAVLNGCLTPCRLCDKVQPLKTRQSVWARTQQLWKQAERARDQSEQEAAAEAAKAQAEVAQGKRERRAEARRKRRAAEAAHPRTPGVDAESQSAWSGELLYGGNEKKLQKLLRALEAQEARRSSPNASIDDLD
jgi:hypothetical protein